MYFSVVYGDGRRKYGGAGRNRLFLDHQTKLCITFEAVLSAYP